jgi:division/cell wall cluster transcriptional repressor MraZ
VKSAYKFNSTNFLTVDEKSRLLIPAEVRRKLDPTQDTDVFVIKIGNNGKLWMWPERYYDARVFNEDANLEIDDIDPTPEQLERMLSRSADIYRVPMDKQGRILLPESVMELTKTGRDVALLGVFNHLQLWNRDDFAKRQLEKQNTSPSNGIA